MARQALSYTLNLKPKVSPIEIYDDYWIPNLGLPDTKTEIICCGAYLLFL